MDRHFPPGLDIDAIWTGHTDLDGSTALLLVPRQIDHAFIPLARVDGDGISIGNREAHRISRGLMPDPLDVEGPSSNTFKSRLERFAYSTGLRQEPSGAEQMNPGPKYRPPTYTTQGNGPTATPMSDRIRALRKPAVDPLERLREATPPPAPRVGRQL